MEPLTSVNMQIAFTLAGATSLTLAPRTTCGSLLAGSLQVPDPLVTHNRNVSTNSPLALLLQSDGGAKSPDVLMQQAPELPMSPDEDGVEGT